ncbi:hypothetical protein E2C01_023551 [Portunus trituberculatus]|uniref:Uncharacterized protein n=1 Tax=Portunus trituberculatus TaxID=210409 RepID=A0A5B7E9B5_PORTR|nr:hypothetical protein [Portunus trituberculatus]
MTTLPSLSILSSIQSLFLLPTSSIALLHPSAVLPRPSAGGRGRVEAPKIVITHALSCGGSAKVTLQVAAAVTSGAGGVHSWQRGRSRAALGGHPHEAARVAGLLAGPCTDHDFLHCTFIFLNTDECKKQRCYI